RAVRGGGLFEGGDVAERVGRLVGGEVGGVGGAAAGGLADVDFHDHRAVVETHGRAIGAGAESAPDVLRRQRVECAGDLSVLVPGYLRGAPQRDIVGRRRRGQQRRLLVRHE